MNRTILTAALALVVGVSSLVAQKAPKAKKGDAAATAPTGPTAKSKEEAAAVRALLAAMKTGPDAIIAAAEDLLTKYADTDFKDMALFAEAGAYQQKQDYDKAEIFGERTLEANPKNFQASLMLAELLAQRTRANDLDKEEKLGKAEKYANQTIQILKDIPKPNPNLADADWENAKKDLTALCHNALGVAALARKKYDVAFTEFKAAEDSASHPEPAYQVREASALELGGKNDDAVAICDKIMADPQTAPQIRQVAQAVRAQAIKAGAKNTNAPAAPAATPPPAAQTQ